MTLLAAVGRAVIGAFFILAGVNKILNYDATQKFMQEGGIPDTPLPLVIALEILGGLIVASGRPVKYLPLAAFALAFFTFLTNLAFHRFWTMEGQIAQLELSLFFKNLAIMGGLILVAGTVHKLEK